MYPPLKFIEQMESYFKLSNARHMESVVNNMAMRFADEIIQKQRGKLYHDFGCLRSFGNDEEKVEVAKSYVDLYNRFCNMLKIEGMESINDFVDLLIYYDARGIWRRNKLSYLVDNELFGTLMNMNTPKLAPVDCLTKLPAPCFYIDYNGMGSELCSDLDGTFVITDKSNDELNIILLHLVSGRDMNRELIVTTVYRLPLDEGDRFVTDCNIGKESVIHCEDGVTRKIDEGKLCKFIYNFLIYFHAANRDVEISERTRKNHEKVQKVIKNKFREVKEFEVGFSYGRTIRQGGTKVKYVNEGEEDKSKVAGSGTKRSHYRSAHWHHYWTGKGDEKKLIIKWVEGVFVNGGKDEAENVSIHKVK